MFIAEIHAPPTSCEPSPKTNRLYSNVVNQSTVPNDKDSAFDSQLQESQISKHYDANQNYVEGHLNLNTFKS